MESLESKLDRLTADQRKEIEDFVDFLLYRSGNLPAVPGTRETPPVLQNVAPPPFVLSEPVYFAENHLIQGYDSHQDENPSVPVKNVEQVKPIQEIILGGEDRINREYMDYGQFEQKSSPATIAVKNVKEKLQKREEQEKPRVSLDWID
ncbi:MAG: hypothetical protein M0Q91_08230 [Methanoregula sp.]|jgi:hypothetical protein|nr:hypothetical protein [Methanoregula sp.]